MTPLSLRQLRDGSVVRGHALVAASARATARSGTPFLRLRLADVHGVEIPAVQFDCAASPPPSGSVVLVRGVVQAFRGSLSLKLDACEVDLSVPAQDFLAHIPCTRAGSLAEFDALVARIDDLPLRALVDACFTEDIRAKFATMPASVHHHGAAIGGLLAHTLRVARIAMAMVELAPDRIDRDVLLAAALLHDVAKIDTYLPEPGAGETECGRLFGHVLLGLLRVTEALPRIPNLADERAQAVLHAIAAAHGRLEYGAPVMPATLEALLLHHADLVEARIESALTAYERMAAGETWTAYLPAFGGPLRAPPAQS